MNVHTKKGSLWGIFGDSKGQEKGIKSAFIFSGSPWNSTDMDI